VTIALGNNPSAGTLSGTKTVSAVGGLATFNDLSVDTAGSYTLLASGQIFGATVSNAFTITAPAASGIAATAGSGQSATINSSFVTTLQATVTNATGNPVSGVNVTFTAPASGASGKFANNTRTTTAVTNSSGIATAATFTANSTAGQYAVTAHQFGIAFNHVRPNQQ
jgi:adhesin/invasin